MHLYVVKDLFMFICSCFPPTGDRLFLLLTWNLLAWWWEKAMAPHSSPLAWKIPWMAEPGRLRSMGWLRVGHDWATSLSLFTFMHWRRKWQATPVFLPRESQRWGSLVGCRPMGLPRVGHDWSDLAAAAWWWGSGRFLVSCLGLTLRQAMYPWVLEVRLPLWSCFFFHQSQTALFCVKSREESFRAFLPVIGAL